LIVLNNVFCLRPIIRCSYGTITIGNGGKISGTDEATTMKMPSLPPGHV